MKQSQGQRKEDRSHGYSWWHRRDGQEYQEHQEPSSKRYRPCQDVVKVAYLDKPRPVLCFVEHLDLIEGPPQAWAEPDFDFTQEGIEQRIMATFTQGDGRLNCNNWRATKVFCLKLQNINPLQVLDIPGVSCFDDKQMSLIQESPFVALFDRKARWQRAILVDVQACLEFVAPLVLRHVHLTDIATLILQYYNLWDDVPIRERDAYGHSHEYAWWFQKKK